MSLFLGIEERIGRTEATQRELVVNLKVSEEQWQGMRSKNKVLYKQNEELGGRLGAEQVKNDELTSDVAALRAELKKLSKSTNWLSTESMLITRMQQQL
ncbi:hypothetical protein PVK06_008148 [Gossypium arboreum]|uniref:Uncharacterized protein n=1 Tax=Gossypium arboreum TaxID=29729 RepID=A0ABR0QJG3_GOSAR|nr:hypothetical protein PVK06_008148 [Gossypium arboreum]